MRLDDARHIKLRNGCFLPLLDPDEQHASEAEEIVALLLRLRSRKPGAVIGNEMIKVQCAIRAVTFGELLDFERGGRFRKLLPRRKQ